MNKPLESKKMKRLLSTIQDMHDPHLLEVSSAKLNINTGKQEQQPTYIMCSACYAVIKQTWDHADWCELFKEEELSKWLKNGKNEK